MPGPRKSLNSLVSPFPLPVVLVSCANERGKVNVSTASFVGIVSLRPKVISVSLLRSSYTCSVVSATKKFGVNIPDGHLLWQVDRAGMLSGRDREDKLADLGLTSFPGPKTGVPLIEQCPINVECTVWERLSFHDCETFLGEVAGTLAEERLVSARDHGKLDLAKLEPFVFIQGEYWSLFERIGRYGFSRQGGGHEGERPKAP